MEELGEWVSKGRAQEVRRKQTHILARGQPSKDCGNLGLSFSKAIWNINPWEALLASDRPPP